MGTSMAIRFKPEVECNITFALRFSIEYLSRFIENFNRVDEKSN